MRQVVVDRLAGLLRDLEANRPSRFALSNRGSINGITSSMEYLIGCANGRSRTGPILRKIKRVRSIITTAAVVSISKIVITRLYGSGGWKP